MVLNPSVEESGRDRTETLSLLRKATMESIAEAEEEKSTDKSFWFLILYIIIH